MAKRRETPEAAKNRLYREGWSDLRKMSPADISVIEEMLDQGTFRWADFFDEKPSPYYLAGFKDSAWKWPDE